ncbi:GNAT family N-acetyltransferase [Roseivivax sp. CAU 1761]
MTDVPYIDCSIREAWGSADGFVCAHDEDAWRDYLADIGVGDDIFEPLESAMPARIAVFREMDVMEDSRGQGHGGDLVARMMRSFRDAKADVIVLFADLDAGNAFDLEAWYEKHGFQRVDTDKTAPCMMIGAPDLLAEIRRRTGLDVASPSPR